MCGPVAVVIPFDDDGFVALSPLLWYVLLSRKTLPPLGARLSWRFTYPSLGCCITPPYAPISLGSSSWRRKLIASMA